MTKNLASDRMSIRFRKKQAFERPLYFEVCVQVELGGREVVWMIDVLPGMRVQIYLDSDQQLILIAHGQELLVDSSGVDRTFPVQVQEEALNQAEKWNEHF